MRQDRFYVREPERLVIEEPFLIHKIKNVLRKREAQEIILFDGKGKEYRALIRSLKPRLIELENLELVREETPSYILSLGFSLLKSWRADFVFQKATELGAGEFIPLLCENSIVRKLSSSKLNHYRKVVLEAVSQSKRLFIPEIRNLLSLASLIEKINNWDAVLVAHPYSSLSIKDLFNELSFKNLKRLLLLVGPEGGFSKKELEEFRNINNVYLVKLSNFILRAETVSIFLVGLINYVWENVKS